jgi:hypothetical protein
MLRRVWSTGVTKLPRVVKQVSGLFRVVRLAVLPNVPYTRTLVGPSAALYEGRYAVMTLKGKRPSEIVRQHACIISTT